METCCKQLIKTDIQISLAVLNNIANEIRKALLRLQKVERKHAFLNKCYHLYTAFERIGNNLYPHASPSLHRALCYNSKRNVLKVTSD